MVSEYEKTFPDSQLMSYVYTQAAQACRQKGDLEKLVEYGQKSLKLDADNLFSMILEAVALSQPKMLRGSVEERDQRLSQAENHAMRALMLIETIPKQPNEPDEQFQRRKAGLSGDAHSALGMVYMQRDESAKAIEEFKKAISLMQNPPSQLYFRLGEVYETEGRTQEAIEAFARASELGQGTVLKTLSDQRIEALNQKK